MKSGSKQPLPSSRQRRWHPKVNSGCLTCRRRRVKCDEQRPICKLCYRLDLRCHGEGYGTDASPTRAGHVQKDFHVITPEVYESASSSSSSSIRRSISSDTSSDSVSSPESVIDNQVTTRLPSISTILGAGRYDPFSSSFVTNASLADRRNLDHAVYYQWSIFATSEKQQDLNTVRSEIMSYALNEPVAWYTIIYAGASHHAYWSQEPAEHPQQDLVRLSLKTRAIQAMIHALKYGSGEISDEIILSMVVLSAQGTGDCVRREKRSTVQSRKTLVRAMDAEYYGALDPGTEHLKVLYKLVERRGGIQTISSRAVRVAAILFDVWNAWKSLGHPGFPMIQTLPEILQMRTWSMDAKSSTLYHSLTQSLVPIIKIAGLPECTRLLQVVESLRVLTTDLDQIQRTPKAGSVLSAPNQPLLIWLRSMQMHVLLTSPRYTAEALNHDNKNASSFLIYELCRISCFMYAQLWLHPVVTKKTGHARRLVSMTLPLLSAAVTRHPHNGVLSNRFPDFVLWTVVLSLLCAYEDFDMTEDTTALQQIATFLPHVWENPLPESWSPIPNLLEKFLWARSECELTGREAWQQACKLLLSSASAPTD